MLSIARIGLYSCLVVLAVLSSTVASAAMIYTQGDATPSFSVDSDWSVTDLTFGQFSAGQVHVTGGKQLRVTDTLDSGAHSIGAITIDGPGSELRTDRNTYIGWAGQSTVNVTNGAYWHAPDHATGLLTLAWAPGTGIVNVSGANSRWQSNTETQIGSKGTGVVNITAGGAWTTTTHAVNLGGYQSSYDSTWHTGIGRATIDASTWTASSTTHVGFYGTGEVTVDHGGAWNCTAAVNLAQHSDASVTSSAEVTIDNASTWSNTQSVTVGRDGDATLTVADGSTWTTSRNTYFAHDAGSTADFTLDSSTLTTPDETFVGRSGQAEVMLKNGASWTAQGPRWGDANIHLGQLAGSSGKVTVDASTWSAPKGSIMIGDAGEGEIIVRNGGMLTVDGTVTLGDNTGSSGSVTVDGSTSVLSTESNFSVGISGIGTVTVKNGASWESLRPDWAPGYVFVGGDQSAIHIQGADSSWTTGVEANISGSGTVNVSDGAAWQADSYLSLASFGEGDLNITSGGSLTVTTRTATVGALGVMTVDGGSADLQAGVTNSGAIKVLKGLLTLNGASSLVGGAIEIGLAGTTAQVGHGQLAILSDLLLGGDLDIVWHDGFEARGGDRFDLFDVDPGAAMTGTFLSVDLPVLSNPAWSWNIDSLYTTGEIWVVPEPATMALLALGALAVFRRPSKRNSG